MLGDGNTPYDQEHDGEKNSLGACSVRTFVAYALGYRRMSLD